MKTKAIVLLFLSLSLAACTPESAPLPEGVHTVSGTLQAVPLSLKRRGTHALLGPEGTISTYVESRSVDLTELDGHDVVLRGTFEANLSEDLPPVFVVDAVLEGGEEALRPWAIPALKLSLKLPKSWQGNLKGNVATFTGSGAQMVMLEIRTSEAPVVSSSSSSMPSSLQNSFSVGLRRATASVSADQRTWIVKTEPNDGQNAVIFTFTLAPERPAEMQIAQFQKFLKSAAFKMGMTSTVSSAASAQSHSAGPASLPGGSSLGSPNDEGMPCGGPAGILCPSGFYCRITDTTLDAGTCAKR